VIEALTIASAGMLTALNSAGAAARVIANPKTAPAQMGVVPRVSPAAASTGVSGDTLSAFTSLLEAELSFKANAAVVRTSSQMIEALYKSID
jgi:hypothetical protein